MGKGFMNSYIKLIEEHYPDKAEKLKHEAKTRFEKYSLEEIDKPDEVRKHTVEKILPTIAVYEAFEEVFGNKQEGYDFLYNSIQKKCEEVAPKLQRIARTLGLYHLGPMIMKKIIHKHFGVKSGFEMKDFKTKSNECHIDMLVCPYNSLCRKYGHPELVRVFCDGDDVVYGNMHPKLSWERTETLGRGHDKCNFILKVNK